MALNLPIDVLRSFVAVVDGGSMLRASERVFLSQPAVSLQIKRLEELLQLPLFVREGRRLVLTPQGEGVLAHAREMLALNDRIVAALSGDMFAGPVRIGFVQDFAETLLQGLLAQFAALHPEARLEIRVGGTPHLHELLDSDRLDLILGMGAPGDPAAIRTEAMRWFGQSGLSERDPVLLAVLERPCRFRDAAISALEQAGRTYQLVVETASLSVLRAAVLGGVGVTCRTDLFAGLPSFPDEALPSLPQVTCILRRRDRLSPPVRQLHDLIYQRVVDAQ
ncbi:DNA-binding transcriptional regulator, LysR family [Sphingomonas gellani]|uniref:DNA-binding transcriptional regulator, LysR family n=1 Tax=Sphingomonas gellani TaxID=1166340 RepID=A0A1H8GFA2_9SPHN|nr:LysR substrate-binding domain-containing protein [Sphingomonas gellani]SEN42821.1 DNA-binding transcriptional regulator, LysR family [Sphingomonas gellani]